MKKPLIYQVDAFTEKAYAGNPAAVCLLETAAPDSWMQAVAAEMMVSATAFVVTRTAYFDLRWFTPKAELTLCGHATLAAAHILWTEGMLPPAVTGVFRTASGELRADFESGWIELDFPARPPRTVPRDEGLLSALGVESVRYTASNGLDVMVELDSEADVQSLRPDFVALSKFPVRGVIVTAAADSARCDFVSRFFAPSIGIAEDPVTGSAHCCLGPFWSERLGRTDLTAQQLSARGGWLRVRTDGNRVLLGGQAVTVMRGVLLSAPG